MPKRGIQLRQMADLKVLALDSTNFGLTSTVFYPGSIWATTGTWFTTQTAFRGWVAHRTFVADSLTVEVTTAGAGGALGRVGLYGPDINGEPGNLLEDLGTFAGDSTGVKTMSFAANRMFQMGEVYWFALQVDDATIAFRRSDKGNLVGRPSGGASGQYMYRDSGAAFSGGLPTAPSTGILNQAEFVILVGPV